MDIIASFIAGAVAKFYDDGVDMKFIENEYFKKFLETFHCYLLGALAMNNFTFSVINIIINSLNFLANNEAFENPYEFSLLAAAPIFLFFSYYSREYLNFTDFIFIFILSITLFLEPFIVKEERSPRKFFFRLCTFFVFVFFLFINFNLSKGIYLLLVNSVGYLLISAIIQGYYVKELSFYQFYSEITDGTIVMFKDFKKLLSSLKLACIKFD